MSLFVAVLVDGARCRAGQPCTACVVVCPVSIFRIQDGLAAVVGDNEDECTLCDLCLQRCPTDAVTIRTHYANEVRPARRIHERPRESSGLNDQGV
jgi:NAD-dependent dihydropyrimidine dehydrogenase PreA subunit